MFTLMAVITSIPAHWCVPSTSTSSLSPVPLCHAPASALTAAAYDARRHPISLLWHLVPVRFPLCCCQPYISTTDNAGKVRATCLSTCISAQRCWSPLARADARHVSAPLSCQLTCIGVLVGAVGGMMQELGRSQFLPDWNVCVPTVEVSSANTRYHLRPDTCFYGMCVRCTCDRPGQRVTPEQPLPRRLMT